MFLEDDLDECYDVPKDNIRQPGVQVGSGVQVGRDSIQGGKDEMNFKDQDHFSDGAIIQRSTW
jgi:hypothetical protein